MGSLVFLRRKLGSQILVVGVKRPEDDFFYHILGDSQRLSFHPVSIQHKILTGRGLRTPALRLSEPELKVYVQDGQFNFRGSPLQTGKQFFWFSSV